MQKNFNNTKSSYQYDFFGQISLNQQEYRNIQLQTIGYQTVDNSSSVYNFTYENQFHHAIQSFIKVDCLKSDQLKRLVKCIFKLEVFKKLGMLLFQVCLQQFNLVSTIDKFDRLETIRQKIYDNLQQLIVIFGKDKDRYLPVMPLLFCAIIKKMFTICKKFINPDQKYKLFHIVFFEIKGQLVSDQFLQGLITKHFNQNYTKFIKEYSENITPVKNKKQDKSLKRVESINILENKKISKGNKQNTQTQYQTNKVLLSKYIQPKPLKNQENIRKVSPRNLLEIRRRQPY